MAQPCACRVTMPMPETGRAFCMSTDQIEALCEIVYCPLHQAAPKLLAACKEALEQLNANMPKGNIREAAHFHALNYHAAACKSLHAAIQHAEGRG